MLSSSIDSILRSSSELSEPVHVTGTTAPARALLIARFALSILTHSKPLIIVLCPNDDIASELCGDLETLTSLLDENPLRISHLPTWEQSPYSPIALSLRTRLVRLDVLSQLVKNAPPHILVTSI